MRKQLLIRMLNHSLSDKGNALAGGKQGDMAQAVRDLHDLYTAAAAEPWSYEWLSVPGVAALVHLVSACMLRPPGKLSLALEQAHAGQQLMTDALQAEGVDLQVS